ncbi:MAG: glucose-6-phosphate isomerase [Acidobacteria bacterium OLB17]|nr:MAG: glucose-6-phosphate isomerase [Acidobacteria bacterium OLB17]MCZ2391213.1 bifunctional transaldolase/phosoglucose isomerase [Acidobacteriota bacterium]
MRLNTMKISLPAELAEKVGQETDSWNNEQKIDRIWRSDASVWQNEDEANWLGWLDIVQEELARISEYNAFADDVRNAGFRNILLMGMGGSSLCPEVLGITFGKTNFHILDSTVPARIRAIEGLIDIDNTLFIVASKSGSTLEPNCFLQYFFDVVEKRKGVGNAGKQFVAITDPGSKLEKLANDAGFRYIFSGTPSIGGRFSALSAFGLTAAASMGIDVAAFLDHSAAMTDACRASEVAENPGAQLGVLLGVCQRNGRDKLTLVLAPEFYDLGAWLEQLIAESTGKNGIAIIPVDREPVEEAGVYGADRIFAFIGPNDDANLDARFAEISATGHPAVRIGIDSPDLLGQEFFRWEFATAVAGSIMGINPFNQPDVESAKVEARKLTDRYEQEGKLPAESPFFSGDGFAFFAPDEHAGRLSSSVTEITAASLLAAHLDTIGKGDYFALLAFIEMSSGNARHLEAIREKVLRRTHAATCLGFGPRFLHSTGQAYKGGGSNGVFLQITADDAVDISVPGQKYTFGVVKAAQARGDFQVLADRGRRVLRIHLGGNVAVELERLFAMLG